MSHRPWGKRNTSSWIAIGGSSAALLKAVLAAAVALCGAIVSKADDAAGATWKHPLVKATKLDSPLVEVTPFVFKDRLYRLDNWQKQWETPDSSDGVRFQEDEVRIRDLQTDRIVSIPLVGHGLGMAFVWKDRVYVFAGDWGRERKWQIDKIEMTSSGDLVNWTKPVVVLQAEATEKFFNVSVCRGQDRFVLLVESNDPTWPAFTFKYFTSGDLIHWTRVPDAIYGRDKYVGGPALYFEDGYYYTLYLQSLGRGRYETRITRSLDLVAWQDAPEGRPFVTFNPENKVHSLRPSDIRECNASDAEVCEWQGKTLVYYTGGDQHFAGDLQVAEYGGTPAELFQTFFAGTTAPASSATVDSRGIGDAVAWLESESQRMIRDCRRTMENGSAAFPPQVGIGYEAFWLRDYAYMIEGYIQGFSDKEIRDACLVFVDAQRADGACVDCVKYDGTPIYKPGYGSMGANPVADGSQFTVDVAWHTYQRLQDKELLGQIIDRLIKGMNAVPRNQETGLVHISSELPWDRCPYGFTDTVRKQGDVLFSSLLFVQASRQLGDLLETSDRPNEARQWREEAEKVSANIRQVFWDPRIGLFRAATVKCKEPDIWGSAFAVYLDVASQEQAITIARYFKNHYSEIVQNGQIRHLPGGVYWEQARERDRYQNGAFWATPTGWFVFTLDLVDPKLADRTVIDLVNDFQKRGCVEWSFGDTAQLPNYLASSTNPLPGIRKMLERRRKGGTSPR